VVHRDLVHWVHRVHWVHVHWVHVHWVHQTPDLAMCYGLTSTVLFASVSTS